MFFPAHAHFVQAQWTPFRLAYGVTFCTYLVRGSNVAGLLEAEVVCTYLAPIYRISNVNVVRCGNQTMLNPEHHQDGTPGTPSQPDRDTTTTWPAHHQSMTGTPSQHVRGTSQHDRHPITTWPAHHHSKTGASSQHEWHTFTAWPGHHGMAGSPSQRDRNTITTWPRHHHSMTGTPSQHNHNETGTPSQPDTGDTIRKGHQGHRHNLTPPQHDRDTTRPPDLTGTRRGPSAY